MRLRAFLRATLPDGLRRTEAIEPIEGAPRGTGLRHPIRRGLRTSCVQAEREKSRAVPAAPERPYTRQVRFAGPMAAGAAMIVWSGAIHLDLWNIGYGTVPTIGPLFLFQAITAFVLGALVLLVRRVALAVVGALFLASTAAGLVWSAEWGLFGFRDSFAAPFASESLGVEAAGVAVLVLATVLARRHLPWRRTRSTPAPHEGQTAAGVVDVTEQADGAG